MKKILKVIGISLLVLLLMLFILPFAFKGKIVEVVKNESNKMLNAHLEFSGMDLSFIRNFPNATVSFDNLCVTGIDDFNGDTLIYVKRFDMTINLKSLLGNAGYEISKIRLNEGLLHAVILENGKANWDIMKSEDSAEEKDSSSDFKLFLKSVTADRMDVFYDDESLKMNVALIGIQMSLSGDMTADNTQIKTNLTSESFNFVMDKIPYLSNIKATADIKLDADFKNSKYVFSDNVFKLNDIEAGLDGWFAMPDETGVEMDIRLNAPKTQFKDILSLVPAIYSKDFKDVKASGEVVLDAYVKGLMQGDTIPSFDVKIDIANAQFQYPSLPKSVNNINLKTHISNSGVSADNTIVDVQVFHFEIGNNPFDLNLYLKTPVSDPDFALTAAGHLDLGMIKDVYPLEDMELNGKLDANMKLVARMSAIEKEQYDRINASGTLNLKDMIFKGAFKEDVLINRALLSFSPRYLDLANCEVKIGKNDLTATGKLENFIPYALKEETLKGNLSINSNYLNLNDFMTDEKSAEKTDTVSSEIFVVPRNIDFNLSGNFKEVKFENLAMTDVSGQIGIKNGKVELKNVKMNALDGALAVNGYYDTSVNPKQPETSLDLNIKNASFAKAFASFETIRKFAPIFEAIGGNFSTSFQMKTPLGAGFMPVLTAFTAQGLLQSNDMEVKNVEALNLIASTLKNESLKDLKIKDLNLPFSINGGKVTVKPFDVNFGGGKMNLSGTTGLDQTIDYLAKVDLPDKLTKGYINKVSLKIGGTFKNPKVSLDTKDLAGQALNKLAGSVLGGDDSTSASDKMNAEITKQADALRQQAKEAGEKLISEAEKQGQKLIDEANKTKNPLAKLAAVKAAEATAKKMKDEALKQSQNLYGEAEKKIQELENNSKNQTPK